MNNKMHNKTPAEFAAKLKRELQEFGKVIKALGLKPQ